MPDAPQHPPRLLLPLLVLAGLMIVWGLSIPATKIALQTMPPLALTAYRYLAAAPCFAVMLLFRKRPPARHLLAMAGLGVLGIDAGQVLQSFGVVRTTASIATVLSATSPMFIAGFAAAILGQRVGMRHLGGMAVALAGVGLVAADSPAAGTAQGDLWGDLLVLSSTASIAAYYVLASRMITRYGVITVTGWSCLFATIGLIPPALWETGRTLAMPSWPVVLIIVYLGWLVTVAGLWIWLHMLRILPARIAASSQFVQPLIGVASSALLLDEPLGLRFAAGAALVFAGIGLTVLPGRRIAAGRGQALPNRANASS